MIARSGFLHLPFTLTEFPSNSFVCNTLAVLSLALGARTPDDKYGCTIRYSRVDIHCVQVKHANLECAVDCGTMEVFPIRQRDFCQEI